MKLLSQEFGSMKHENMNECLEECLQSIKNSKKRTFSQALGVSCTSLTQIDSRAYQKELAQQKKRLRKNEDQNKFLLGHYIAGEQWSKDRIQALASQTGLK